MTIVTKRESVFIKIKDLSKKEITDIKNKLSFKFYAKDAICNDCDNRNEKHNDLCDSCANYTGGFELAKTVKIKNNSYLKIPVGSSEKILTALSYSGHAIEVRDKSPINLIKSIEFLGTLSEEQRRAVDSLKKNPRGVLKAPARSGKTVMSTVLICELGGKTLILASQRDWLMGFKETFIGSKTQKPLTDLNPKRIKLCKTLKDFQETDICLATVQTFYSDGGETLLTQIRDLFTTIVVDEVHTGAANKYIDILGKLNTRHTIGLSATPSRKDSRFILVTNVLGPIVYEAKVQQMKPLVRIVRSPYSKSYRGNVPWARIVSAMENDKARLKLIAEWAIKDAKEGHLVLIPLTQVKPITELIKIINEMAGKQLAYPFTGQLKKDVRDSTIQKAREYKIKILVGTAKVLSVGINIPRASALYEVILSSNLEAAEQRMTRVLTKVDKPQPIIRFFLDDFSIRRNCMRNEYFNMLRPKLRPLVGEAEELALKSYFSGKS
jgi:superfamily II DNA or RNA helicase